MSFDLYKNTYRVSSTRLQGWDYSVAGYYFITIVAGHRISYFGKIDQAKIYLSNSGLLTKFYWEKIPLHFPQVSLDEYIVMPDHVHGIIVINKPFCKYNLRSPQCKDVAMQRLYSNISPKPQSIPTIIRSFKSISTREIRKRYDTSFHWQSRFYDRIIRNENELHAIRKYIRNNPSM